MGITHTPYSPFRHFCRLTLVGKNRAKEYLVLIRPGSSFPYFGNEVQRNGELMAIENQTNRIFLRRDTAVFRVNFFSDVALTMPVSPLDATQYPSYAVYDVNNNSIQSGVGQPEASPGRYKAEFIVPNDAPLSWDQKRWRIEWHMVSNDSPPRQYDFVEEFDVTSPVITASENREQKIITLVASDTRVILRQSRRPVDLELSVFYGNNISNTIVSGATLDGGAIQEVPDGDSLVYYYDIPGTLIGPNCQTFSVIWKVRNSVADPQSFIYQVLTAVTPQMLSEVTSVRMLVDKLQKRMGLASAYEDSDIVEYLARGQELVNSVYPTTFYSFGFMPNELLVYHVLFSAWYGLMAQSILNAELGINFSGQTVTLDYDPSGAISDVAGKWMEFANENLPKVKMAMLRRGSAVGTVAGRGMRAADLNTFVYKIASLHGGHSSIVGMLNRLGLLF